MVIGSVVQTDEKPKKKEGDNVNAIDWNEDVEACSLSPQAEPVRKTEAGCNSHAHAHAH